jgi:RNA polymerase sigma factor (TIGR02999 family)
MPEPADLSSTVYDHLRRVAAAKLRDEPAGHTLDATALVHEAYLKLSAEVFASKGEFLRAAAVAMQRVLVDHARAKRADKRGGGAKRFELAEGDRVHLPDPDAVLAVDEALESLAAEDPTAAEVARLRVFAGLTVDEAAGAVGVSRATAFREWAYARAWLATAMRGG